MLDLKEIEANYAKFSDLKIKQIAREGARDIRPEVIPILKRELEKRGLGTSYFSWIDVESKKLIPEEITTYEAMIQQNGCLVCGNKSTKIKGFRFEKYTSFLLGGVLVKDEQICCLACAKKRRNQFLLQNLLFGLWSGQGLFMMPVVTFYNLYNRLPNRVEVINEEIITAFLDNNIGKIRQSRNKMKYLERAVKNFNGYEEYE